MKSTHTISALMLIATTVLGGCAANGPQQTSPSYSSYSTPSQSNASSYGTIESIQITRAGNPSSGGGAVGGAVVGNSVEQNRNAQTADMYQIRVRLDNGDSTTVVQDSVVDLRVGNRVRVVDGRAYRY